MTSSLHWALVASCIVIGCRGDRDARRDSESTDGPPPPFRAPVVNVDEKALSALPVWTLGPRPLTVIEGSQTDQNYDLYNIGDIVRSANGDVSFAANHGPINVYDRTGKHLRRIGRKGSGPGEFQQIVQLGRIGRDTIATFDNALRRISIFDPNGEFVRSVPVRGMVGQTYGRFTYDGRFVGERRTPAAYAPGTKYRERLEIVEVELRSGAEKPVAQIDGMWMVARTGSAPFSPRPSVAVGGDYLFVTSGDRYEVQIFDRIRPHGLLRLELPLRAVTDADLRRWAQNSPGSEDSAMHRRYVEQVRSKAVPYRAQIHDLLADERGFLWVNGQALRDDKTNRSPWIIFTPEGAAVARFPSMIGKRHVRSVGSDHVILMNWGEDEPASIEVWPLVK